MSHSRSVNVLNDREDYYYRKEYLLNVRDYEETRGVEQRDTPGGSILDSSLITQTKLKKYNLKVVECGDYKSIYFYPNEKYKKEKDNEKIIKQEKLKEKNNKKQLIKKMFLFDDLDLTKNKESRANFSLNEIEEKNLNRTKIELQRLIKSNINEFKTFITLTFDTNKNSDININDIKDANKKFNIFKTYMKKLKNDFKYIYVPEFQKRGAVHYHLLTNIDYNSSLLLNEITTFNKKTKSYKTGKPIVGWKYGYSMAIPLSGINVVGYMTKYMTKDIDNRLFGCRKYSCSYNLKKPKEVYIDLKDNKDVLFYLKFLNDTEICYKNKYYDKFGNEVFYLEYLKNNFENTKKEEDD